MIRITTWPEHVTGDRAITGQAQRDYATCTWDGRDFQVLKPSATTALARMLAAAGYPDQPWQAYPPDGTPSLRGKSLHAWAKRSVTESDRGGFKVRPFAEHPRAGDRGRVQTASGVPVERVAGRGPPPSTMIHSGTSGQEGCRGSDRATLRPNSYRGV
jgi:hypothetical protein